MATFIPEGIRAIIKNSIYFIVFVVCALLMIGWLVSLIGGVGYPIWPPQFARPR